MEDRFPDALKVCRVVPVYKKGDRCIVSSYRTIAIISAVVIKVLGTILKVQLLEYVEANTSKLQVYSLLCRAQHEFRKGKSTTTALLDMVRKDS